MPQKKGRKQKNKQQDLICWLIFFFVVAIFIFFFVKTGNGYLLGSIKDNGHSKINTLTVKKNQLRNLSNFKKQGTYQTDEFILKIKSNAQGKIKFSSKNIVEKENTGIKSINKLNQKHKIEKIEKVFPENKKTSKDSKKFNSIFRIKIEPNKNIKEVIKKYSNLPEVEYAEPVYNLRLNVTPNDPYYTSDLWGLKKLQASQAWDVNSGAGVTIAVIDTGVDYNHEDLAANMWTNSGEVGGGKESNGIDDDANGYVDDWRGWDFYGGSGDNNPMDTYGHGTHVAGTIGAVANNSKGVAGLAYSAKIMPLSLWNASTSLDLSKAIKYAADMGAKVSSNSWTLEKDTYSQTLDDAIAYANDTKDQVLVFAAGNDDEYVSHYFPSYSPKVMAIAASTESDARASFSNYGEEIEVAAPGTNIISTYPTDNYAIGSGTSMATPHVSALAGIIRSLDPALTNDEVKNILQYTALDLGEGGKDIYFGNGRINAWDAVQCTNSSDSVGDIIPIYNYYSSGMGIWNFFSCSIAHKSHLKSYSTPTWNFSNSKFASGDVNGDGRKDLVALYNYGNAKTGIWVFTKTAGSYTAKKWWESNSWSWSSTNMQVGDVDNDGNDDIVLTYKYSPSKISIWNFISNGTGISSFSNAFTSTTWNLDNTKLSSTDVNGDGREDLVALYNYGNAKTGIWVFTKTAGSYTAKKWWESGAGAWNWYSTNLQTGDVNNDTRGDIVLTYKYTATSMGIWNFLSNGSDISSFSKVYTSNSWNLDNTKLYHADIDGDNEEDLLALYNYGNANTGFWVFTKTATSYTAKKWWQSGAGNWSWDSTELLGGNVD